MYNLLEKAKNKAKIIFQIDIPFMINQEPLPKIPISEQMGYYDSYKDEITLFLKKIQQTSSKYNLNLQRIIDFVMCHEYGHAKQARIFEDKQVCSWRFKKHIFYATKKEEINFINERLQDFCIDKELYNHNISDPFAILRILDLKQKGSNGVTIELLPMDITIYEFGNLSNSNKNFMKTTIKNVLRKKFDIIYNLMSGLEFTDVSAYKNTLIMILKNIFGLNAYYKPERNEQIFKGRNRPSFWNKNNYDVLQVVPSFLQKL